MNNILNTISENNNDYRKELTALNSLVDEITTTLVGDCVTLSGYTTDFSNSIMEAKEKVVNPVCRIVESYAIKDLRNVESVNEQFIEKINDKLENAEIKDDEDKKEFNRNLNELLNEKYLQIVNIKRVPFFDDNNKNSEIEECILSFKNYLLSSASFDNVKLDTVINSYKEDLYSKIKNSLDKISTLYLNNFINGVSGVVDVTNFSNDTESMNIAPNPEVKIEDIQASPKVEIPEVPVLPSEINLDEIMPATNEEVINDTNNDEMISESVNPEVKEDNSLDNSNLDVEPLTVPEVEPVEVKDEEIKPFNSIEPKKTYDVEEILKIAKSPVASNLDYELVNDNNMVTNQDEKTSSLELDFDEKELVEELISRLSKRLDLINERQMKYDEAKLKLEDDEAFVNNLIESANKKSKELDNFEEELRNKEKELNEKEAQLSRRINEVLPFANAVLKNENES